jgi:hypothetical protein
MSVHVHTARSYCAGSLGLILAMAGIPFGWAYQSQTREFELAEVNGRVTCGGHPLGGMTTIHFLAADERFNAAGALYPDGSFRMNHVGNLGGPGIVPGTYRVCFTTSPSAAVGSSVGEKYQDPRTSDLLAHVGPIWNDFLFSLPEPAPDPSLVVKR